MKRGSLAVAIGALVLASFALASDADVPASDAPPPASGLMPTSASFDAVLDLIDRRSGMFDPSPGRVERWTMRGDDDVADVTAAARGFDVRVTTRLEGAVYESGRADGVRWRRTPNGLVRTVEADVQGDALDQVPFSRFGFARGDCRALYETTASPRQWVVAVRAPHDLSRLLYVDEATGDVLHEVVREAAHVTDIAFARFAPSHGLVRPAAWHLSGAFGDADVSVVAGDDAAVQETAVARPPSTFGGATFDGLAAQLPVHVADGERIDVDVVVNGHPARFQLDSGTTQTLVDSRAAARLGLHVAFGHAVAGTFRVGNAKFDGLSVQTVPIGIADGLLGYEAFANDVVEMNARAGVVRLVHRDEFGPPDGAEYVPVDFSEGMPIAVASFDGVTLSRVALDTGSYRLVVLSGALDRLREAGAPPALSGAKGERDDRIAYLEGALAVRPARFASVRLGPIALHDLPALVQSADNGVTFPLDAIAGTDVVGGRRWWFDAAGGRAWTCDDC